MPARDDTPTGAPVWVDLMTRDQAAAVDFYGRLLGWEHEAPNPDFGGYLNFTLGGARIAGCMGSMDPALPDVWSVYLATDDIARTARDSVAHGGGVIVEPMAVGDLGWMAVLLDATGASIGAWQPGTHRGFGVVEDPGAPAWFELHTRDLPGASDFYRNVFGLDVKAVSDAPELRYSVLTHGDAEYAGIFDATADLPADVGPSWTVYFATADIDAAVATLTDLGGTVVSDPVDTPYGRLATVTDPTGAQFRLVDPPT